MKTGLDAVLQLLNCRVLSGLKISANNHTFKVSPGSMLVDGAKIERAEELEFSDDRFEPVMYNTNQLHVPKPALTNNIDELLNVENCNDGTIEPIHGRDEWVCVRVYINDTLGWVKAALP